MSSDKKRIAGRNAIIWFVSNSLFGLAPLVFLMAVNPVLDKGQAQPEIKRLIEGGIILFLCCALMGAVIIDILLEKIQFKNFAFFALNVAPFILLGIICILYLLVILGHAKATMFSTFSGFYVFVILFYYCLLYFGQIFAIFK